MLRSSFVTFGLSEVFQILRSTLNKYGISIRALKSGASKGMPITCGIQIDISADNSFGVSASQDDPVRVWDLNQDSACRLTLAGRQAAHSLASSPDLRTGLLSLTKGSRNTKDFSLRLFDRESGELLRSHLAFPVRSIK